MVHPLWNEHLIPIKFPQRRKYASPVVTLPAIVSVEVVVPPGWWKMNPTFGILPAIVTPMTGYVIVVATMFEVQKYPYLWIISKPPAFGVK